MSVPEPHRDLLISYTTLRRIIGILGIALPFVLWLGSMVIGQCDEKQLSISNYYHTRMGDVFVGTLCAISLFLFTYKGHNKADGILGNIAGVLGVLVALFPTTLKKNGDGLAIQCNISRTVQNPEWIGAFHNICAGLLLLSLALFSIWLFTKKRDGEEPTSEKKIRNGIYIGCGIVMILCVIACALFLYIDSWKEVALEHKLIFWLETVALCAFGTSWLVKGETLWRDKK